MAALGSPTAVSVLDVGCGTGDGLKLMGRAFKGSIGHSPSGLSYVGLDNSPEMVAQAQSDHRDVPHVRFIEHDVRREVPGEAFDIYLSCGVPYSHLTTDELENALFNIFSAVRRNRSRAAVIVDVLGRYSVEWPSMWALERWPYRMSFFSTDKSMESVDMSVYSSASLSKVLTKCAASGGVTIESRRFFDRSIAVGRHTTTGEYHPDLQPLRTYINNLYSKIRFDLSLLELPMVPNLDCSVTEGFHRTFRRAWNGNVRAADELMKGTSLQDVVNKIGHVPLVLANKAPRIPRHPDDGESGLLLQLAEALRSLERQSQPGLGVGHSLIGLIIVDGRGKNES